MHTLPEPGAVSPADTQQRRRTTIGRWKMLAVLLVCAAPVVASYITYYFIRPEGRTAFGQLIEPQRPIPDLVVQDLDGAPANLQALKGQWLLVSVSGGACDALCQRHLYMQRQVRESLGREKERLDRVWLITDQAPVDAALLPAVRQGQALRVDAAALQRWLAPATGHALEEHLYLVDPLGNWMMRFPVRMDMADAAKARRDIERVLRASASWDKEGR